MTKLLDRLPFLCTALVGAAVATYAASVLADSRAAGAELANRLIEETQPSGWETLWTMSAVLLWLLVAASLVAVIARLVRWLRGQVNARFPVQS